MMRILFNINYLTNTQVLSLRKSFTNVIYCSSILYLVIYYTNVVIYSANTKWSKTQFHKIGLSGECLGRLLRQL